MLWPQKEPFLQGAHSQGEGALYPPQAHLRHHHLLVQRKTRRAEGVYSAASFIRNK